MASLATINGLSEHQKKMGPAKRTAGSRRPVVPETLIIPQTTHTQTKYQFARQALAKAKFQEGKGTKRLFTAYY